MKRMMKRSAAVLAAAVLAATMAGCTVGTPESVGKIGDTQFGSGLYLLMQYQAYQSAASLTEDEDVLKATLTLEDGTTENGAAYVERVTKENMAYYAAVEQKYAELGGELSESDLASVKSETASSMANYGATFAANGIGEETVRLYVLNAVKAANLFDLVYGVDGTDPVADEDLSKYITENFALGEYIVLPNYNYATYTALEEDTTKEILEIAEQVKKAMEEGTDSLEIANQYLPDAFIKANYVSTAEDYSDYVNSALVMPANYSSFGEEAAKAMVAAKPGEVIIYPDTYSIMVFKAQDVLENYSLDVLRSTAISQMKEADLNETLQQMGDGLAASLDSSAMKKLSAKNIKA